MNEFTVKLNNMMEDIAALAKVLKFSIGDLEEKVGLLKQIVGSSRSDDGPLRSRFENLRFIVEIKMLKSWRIFLWDIK